MLRRCRPAGRAHRHRPGKRTSEHTLRFQVSRAISPASKDHPFFVSNPVVVSVLEEEQVWNRTHKYTAAVTMNRRGPPQATRKNSSFVKMTIAVRILQPFDLSGMLLAVTRKIIHLKDE